MSPSPRIRRKLAELADKPVNFEPEALDLAHPPAGWNVDDRRQRLPGEPPGEPVPGGSWEIARRLIRGYEFADPSMVRAFYDPERPLAGRDMLLELRALGIARVYVGVRVGEVYDDVREQGGRRARVTGWYYRTLEGHVEQGQMDWQVWKWLDSGDVEFRVYAVSRTASIANPVIRIGFWLLRDHERALFLESTGRRMRSFTELALRDGRPGQSDPLGETDRPGERVREASAELTARRLRSGDPAHDQLARNVDSE